MVAIVNDEPRGPTAGWTSRPRPHVAAHEGIPRPAPTPPGQADLLQDALTSSRPGAGQPGGGPGPRLLRRWRRRRNRHPRHRARTPGFGPHPTVNGGPAAAVCPSGTTRRNRRPGRILPPARRSWTPPVRQPAPEQGAAPSTVYSRRLQRIAALPGARPSAQSSAVPGLASPAVVLVAACVSSAPRTGGPPLGPGFAGRGSPFCLR